METVNKSSTSIKNWALDDRPREKLLTKGSQTLSDSELLAILINTGSGKRSAVQLAREVLELGGNNLDKLGKLSLKDLMEISGIGEAKAITIIAALEFGRRRQASRPVDKISIGDSNALAAYLKTSLKDHHHEVFAVVFLNRANKINHFQVMSIGGMSQTIVDPKTIFIKALEVKATSIVLCHNHPSGNLKPSRADEEITQKLKNAGRLLDIQVLDHLIVSDEGYFSFADEGIL
ncbi:MAG: DNA repair protein RadC [Bacteroidetes bacterium]|nr:DNA repair protein RadC [Bacteroidota bacterium]